MKHLAQDIGQKLAGAAQTTPRATQNILVVDDLAAARYATCRALQAAGFNTIEAAGGAEALRLAADAAAVVLDVHLPDIHGLEVCRLLRSDPRTARLPIIHLSAVYVTDEHRAAGSSAGADAYLIAPVEREVLAMTIDRLLRAARADQPAAGD